MVVPSFTGVPKFGVPFEFQLTFCTMVYRLPSQAPALLAVAWYTFQISLPSGLVKNLCYCQHMLIISMDLRLARCGQVRSCCWQR